MQAKEPACTGGADPQKIVAFSKDLWYNKLNNCVKEVGGMDIRVGDRIRMRKPHPCGCAEFTVTRIGMDFKIRCERCEHEILLPRHKCEKGIKALLTPHAEEP